MKALIFFPWFFFLHASLGGQTLLVTEIMADPTPSRGILPAAEYLELVNLSEEAFPLEGIGIATGGGAWRSLGGALLPPGRPVILCDLADTASFAPFGPVLGVEGFPTLRNDGDLIVLLSETGDTLLRQVYRPDWHRDPDRESGGWALELLDPTLPYDCDLNWASSQDPRGGTPGMANSGTAAHAEFPALLRVFPRSPAEVSLVFSAALDQKNASDPGAYSLHPEVPVKSVRADFPALREVTLLLAEPLTPGRLYTLSLATSLTDCLGRSAPAPVTASFALPVTPAAGDLVINELLFDPPSQGSPFVELLNRSDKVFNLRDLSLVNHYADPGNRAIQLSEDFLLLPGQYAVLTPSLPDLLRDYRVERPAAVLEHKLPALSRDRGNISLHFAGLTIDSFDYDRALHTSFLADPQGVSLERIDPEGPTQSPANWHSAAQTAGFATPTSQNSQYVHRELPGSGPVSLPYKVFSPDGDGSDDYLLVNYKLDQPGYIIHLWVFDEAGRRIRILAEGELSGTEGSFKWDGTTAAGKTAPPGLYILAAEILGPRGQITRVREVCALAVFSK